RFVPRIAATPWMRMLGDSDFANAVRDVVIDARFIVGVRKPEVRVESMLRIAADGEFSSTHLQVGARGLCSLEIHGLGGVVKVRRVQTMPARHATAVPEEQNEDNNERQNPDGGSNLNPRTRARIAASFIVVVDFTQAHENENQGPVIQQNPPWLERGAPIVQQEENADGNQDDRQYQRHPPVVVLGHGKPPLPGTTHANEK